MASRHRWDGSHAVEHFQTVENEEPGEYLLDHALTRTAGASLVGGNSVRLLNDAADHYPAWLESIRSAKHTIFFESYIIHEDEQGAEFAAALAERARAGVHVRLIYDWMGGVGKSSRRFWRQLRSAGVEVRCFNPVSLRHPLGWLIRDHRKMLAIDGDVGFVTGLCIGQMWMGDAEQGIEPWRDAGVVIRGPAVADIEHAFAQSWAATGEPLPREELHDRTALLPHGNVSLRIVASVPGTAGLLRMDQFVASIARQRLWLADAYFAGVPSYVHALRAAAQDGVDVRLLVPGISDLPWIRPLSRLGYRPLLEAGVRVYEWNGPMMHAKTAVADGRWSRVGSSNLNLASWIGNYELDVLVEDHQFGGTMERTYLEDLERATELMLQADTPVVERPRSRKVERSSGSASRTAAGALRLGHTVRAVLGNRRLLAPADARLLGGFGGFLLAVAAVTLRWPLIVAVPIAVVTGWTGLASLLRAYQLRRARRARFGLTSETSPTTAANHSVARRDRSRSNSPGPEPADRGDRDQESNG
jgi:cardiolipin synthase A/B